MYEQRVTLPDFVKMGEEQASQFDFLTLGDEPDRCDLIKEVYQRIFPWYDEEEDAGDTLNTYRIAIKTFYGKYYRYLAREKQLEILDIKKNTHRITMIKYLSLK